LTVTDTDIYTFRKFNFVDVDTGSLHNMYITRRLHHNVTLKHLMLHEVLVLVLKKGLFTSLVVNCVGE